MLGGVNAHYQPNEEMIDLVCDALLTPNPEAIAIEALRDMRHLWESMGNDMQVVVACLRGEWSLPSEALASLRFPVLVINGEHDQMAGNVEDWRTVIPHCETHEIPGRDHAGTPRDPGFVTRTLEFLARRA